jgi:hypothetical protein
VQIVSRMTIRRAWKLNIADCTNVRGGARTQRACGCVSRRLRAERRATSAPARHAPPRLLRSPRIRAGDGRVTLQPALVASSGRATPARSREMGRAAGLRHVPRIRGAAQLHGPQRHIAHPLTQKYPRFKAHHGVHVFQRSWV